MPQPCLPLDLPQKIDRGAPEDDKLAMCEHWLPSVCLFLNDCVDYCSQTTSPPPDDFGVAVAWISPLLGPTKVQVTACERGAARSLAMLLQMEFGLKDEADDVNKRTLIMAAGVLSGLCTMNPTEIAWNLIEGGAWCKMMINVVGEAKIDETTKRKVLARLIAGVHNSIVGKDERCRTIARDKLIGATAIRNLLPLSREPDTCTEWCSRIVTVLIKFLPILYDSLGKEGNFVMVTGERVVLMNVISGWADDVSEPSRAEVPSETNVPEWIDREWLSWFVDLVMALAEDNGNMKEMSDVSKEESDVAMARNLFEVSADILGTILCVKEINDKFDPAASHELFQAISATMLSTDDVKLRIVALKIVEGLLDAGHELEKDGIFAILNAANPPPNIIPTDLIGLREHVIICTQYICESKEGRDTISALQASEGVDRKETLDAGVQVIVDNRTGKVEVRERSV